MTTAPVRSSGDDGVTVHEGDEAATHPATDPATQPATETATQPATDPATRTRRRRPTHRRVLLGAGASVAALVLIGAVLAGGWKLSDGGRTDRTGVDAAASMSPDADPGGASVSAAPSAAPSSSAPVVSAAPTSAPPAGAPAPPRAGAAPPPGRPGGKPGAANTGPPPGRALTVVPGDQVYATPGQVIDGLDIRGRVEIRARNVTIRNSVIRGASTKCNAAVVWVRADLGASATIQDTEIAAATPHPCLDGIWASATTLLRVNIHSVVDGVKAHDDVTVRDSWVHDLSWFADDPNQGGGETHNDAVQTYEGNRRVTLRHNTLSAGSKGNAAYQVTQDGGKVSTDLLVEDNWLDGGGCTLNFSHKGGPAPMTGIHLSDNRFGRGSAYDCPVLISTGTVLSTFAGNVWEDTGKAVPAPQQHD